MLQAKFIRDKKGLQLVLTPENNPDRALLNELICDNYAVLGKTPRLRVEFEKKGEDVKQISVRKKKYLDKKVLKKLGFTVIQSKRLQLAVKKANQFWLILCGKGIYRVKTLNINDYADLEMVVDFINSGGQRPNNRYILREHVSKKGFSVEIALLTISGGKVSKSPVFYVIMHGMPKVQTLDELKDWARQNKIKI